MAFKEGVADSDTGKHKPTFADNDDVRIEAVPKMAPNSKDGVVRTPHRHQEQGWYDNTDVREVGIH